MKIIMLGGSGDKEGIGTKLFEALQNAEDDHTDTEARISEMIEAKYGEQAVKLVRLQAEQRIEREDAEQRVTELSRKVDNLTNLVQEIIARVEEGNLPYAQFLKRAAELAFRPDPIEKFFSMQIPGYNLRNSDAALSRIEDLRKLMADGYNSSNPKFHGKFIPAELVTKLLEDLVNLGSSGDTYGCLKHMYANAKEPPQAQPPAQESTGRKRRQ